MATRLHQLVTGYRASQVVSTVARFRIADRLASGPLTLDHLAVSLDIAHDYLWQAALLAAVLDANGVARGLVIDGPEWGQEARNRLESRGLSDRIEPIAVAASEALPPSGDLYLLEQLLHDRPDEEASTVLERCREAMDGDGRVVAVEMALFPDSERARSQPSDLNSLVIAGGCQRTTHAYRRLFTSAGLELERVIRLQLEPDFALLVGAPA